MNELIFHLFKNLTRFAPLKIKDKNCHFFSPFLAELDIIETFETNIFLLILTFAF